jgi:DUF1365 family protein
MIRSSQPTLRSAIYIGSVEHHRHTPREHRFRAQLGLLYLDLDEIDRVFSLTPWWRQELPAPASFRRSDYLAGPPNLADAARDRVHAILGYRPSGPVRLLTQVRQFGHVFNPVSFYYCFDQSERLSAVLGEITNTPWGERHCYAIDARTKYEGAFAKCFHVSPFMDMQQTWHWQFSKPSALLQVGMRSSVQDECVFTANLTLHRRRLNAANLHALLARFPLHSLQVLARIHWEALRLWMKGVPFVPHPRSPTGSSLPALANHS